MTQQDILIIGSIILSWLAAKVGGDFGAAFFGATGSLVCGAVSAAIPISYLLARRARRLNTGSTLGQIAMVTAFIGSIAGAVVGFPFGCDLDSHWENSIHEIVESGGRPEPGPVGGGWLIFSVVGGLLGAASGALSGSVAFKVTNQQSPSTTMEELAAGEVDQDHLEAPRFQRTQNFRR